MVWAWTSTSGPTWFAATPPSLSLTSLPVTSPAFTFRANSAFVLKMICTSRKTAQSYSRRRARRWKIRSVKCENLLRRYHLQIVGHREDAGDAVSAKAGHILIRIVIHNAFQSDAAILHDDADRLLHAQGVLLERWIPVDLAV